MKQLISLSIILIMLSGCATYQSIERQKGNGLKKVYTYSYKDVYFAVLKSIANEKLLIVKQDEDAGHIQASHGISWWSWGERIVVYVYKIDENNTEVEIISEKIFSPLNTAEDWRKSIFWGIDEELKK